MKKILFKTMFCFAGMVLVFISCQDNTMTSEKIIAECAKALGGFDTINKITTLSIQAVYPDHGDQPLGMLIKRPNLSLNPDPDLIFDGKRIFFPKGRDGHSDPEIRPESEWKDGEVVIGYHFPAFFEYPADYLGIEDVDSRQVYKLKVNLPLGAVMTYFIDSDTFLPVKATAEFTMNGKAIRDWRDFSDYRDVDGVMYPHGFTYGSRTGRQNGWVSSVEINVPLSDDLFKIPDDIK